MVEPVLGIPTLSAPRGSMDLFDFATKKAKAAQDARKRAEARREARDRAEAAMQDTGEYADVEAAVEAVKERENLLLEGDKVLAEKRLALKNAKAALARTDAAREFKHASEDVKALESAAAEQEKEIRKALASGELPVEERASSAIGAEVVLPKSGRDGMD